MIHAVPVPCRVLESRFLKRRMARLAASHDVVTSDMRTEHDESLEADAWVIAARSSLRGGDQPLSAIAARKVLERRPLAQLALPTRTMLSRCGDDEVARMIRFQSEQAFAFHMAVWISRTKVHRRRLRAVVSVCFTGFCCHWFLLRRCDGATVWRASHVCRRCWCARGGGTAFRSGAGKWGER